MGKLPPSGATAASGSCIIAKRSIYEQVKPCYTTPLYNVFLRCIAHKALMRIMMRSIIDLSGAKIMSSKNREWALTIAITEREGFEPS
jgi:hypothetical protein